MTRNFDKLKYKKHVILGIFLSFSLIEGKSFGRILGVENNNDSRNFPYHVSLWKRTPESEEHICGGAIIDNKHVLTAAHCVFNVDVEELYIGVRFDNEAFGSKEFRHHKVSRYFYPESYINSAERAHENDIAIIKVERYFDLADDEHYGRVFLPEYDNDYEGSNVIFTGYGVSSFERLINNSTNTTKIRRNHPNKLQFYEADILPLEFCRRTSEVALSKGHICTNMLDTKAFSCQDDGGGPLVHKNVILGIRVKSDNCYDDKPEIFTRVSYYLSFIYNILESKFSKDIIYKPEYSSFLV